MRPLRRNGVPGTKVGIAHTFLGIKQIIQNFVGELVTGLAVFRVELADRKIGSRKEQINNLFVLHHATPPLTFIHSEILGRFTPIQHWEKPFLTT